VKPPADIRIGTCAWSFEDWRGVFYPGDLPASQRLPFYASHFNAVEIDSTFYATPSPQTAHNWLDATPRDFVFTCKLPREITHVRKLRGCEGLVDEFLTNILPLKPKLGCVLAQFPAYFTQRQDEAVLREFVQHLPHDFRFAIEFRDGGWHLPRIAHLLEEHGVCWVWNDTTPVERQDEGAFSFLAKTTDFLYVRLLGDLGTKYRGDGQRVFQYRHLMWPRDTSLESWAVRVRQQLPEVSQVFILANNHFEGYSPATCERIAERLGVTLERRPVRKRVGKGRKGVGAEQMELAL
jgi:uncharacterized protein YecE (DUF72 family)